MNLGFKLDFETFLDKRIKHKKEELTPSNIEYIENILCEIEKLLIAQEIYNEYKIYLKNL
jgi:hypothetical protein